MEVIQRNRRKSLNHTHASSRNRINMLSHCRYLEDTFRLLPANDLETFVSLVKQVKKSLPNMLQEVRETSLQSYVFPSLSRIYTGRCIHARTLLLFLFLILLIFITHLCCCWNFQSFV